ncbi:MAG: hypothetical protein OXG15_10140 [Gammaproteobacteria bacterium]|nr:hypothetical protein [Gammaproteobacteria bacterium]
MTMTKTAIRRVFAIATDRIVGYVRAETRYALHNGETVMETFWTRAPVMADGTAGAFIGGDRTRQAAARKLASEIFNHELI